MSSSMNRDYIPDVVRITPNKIGKDNATGRYLIKVYSVCFNSYNLYYYTTKNKAIEKNFYKWYYLSEGQI